MYNKLVHKKLAGVLPFLIKKVLTLEKYPMESVFINDQLKQRHMLTAYICWLLLRVKLITIKYMYMY